MDLNAYSISEETKQSSIALWIQILITLKFIILCELAVVLLCS